MFKVGDRVKTKINFVNAEGFAGPEFPAGSLGTIESEIDRPCDRVHHGGPMAYSMMLDGDVLPVYIEESDIETA